jgi:hypothetical protein
MHRLKKAHLGDMDSITGELIKHGGDIPEELLEQFRKNIREGKCPSSTLLSQLVVVLRSREVYLDAKPHLLQHIDVCGALLAADIPDPEIETRLCDFLDRDGSSVLRYTVLRTLGDHGSTACLDTLRRLKEDSEAPYAVAKLFLNSLMPGDGGLFTPEQLTRGFQHKETILFGDEVRSALQKVVERNRPPPMEWSESTPAPSGIFDIADTHFNNGRVHLENGAVNEALSYLRKATEAIVKLIIKSGKFKGELPKGTDVKDIDEGNLEKLVNAAYKIGVPNVFCNPAGSIQRITNLIVHDQGVVPVEEVVDLEVAKGLFATWKNLRNFTAKELSGFPYPR